MSKKEIIKEDIATYRAYLLLLTTSLFGVVGYAIINIERLNVMQMILGIIASVIIFASFVILLKKYLVARKILGEME
ncbi:MAG: hypothetical protein J1E31_07880 [Helicobacter sp.]|nr:hypothetical protein [Helicobacter sp.]